MKILIINPNTTSAMTHSIGEAARKIATDGTAIVVVNPEHGPASIQGPQDGEDALPGLFETFDKELGNGHTYDAVIIACFDDTGLSELKSRTAIPVLGIGEAAFHAATMLGSKFSVVTTLAVSIPVIEENLSTYGFGTQCSRVRASGVPVLELEEKDGNSYEEILTEAKKAIQDDNCDVIILGCAGMADLAADMTGLLGRPVIDGVGAAVVMCEGLVRLECVV